MNEDGPYIVTLNCKTVKATRDHECAFCDDPIPQGTRYTSFVGLEDGRFVYWKHHVSSCPKYKDTQ